VKAPRPKLYRGPTRQEVREREERQDAAEDRWAERMARVCWGSVLGPPLDIRSARARREVEDR
jgi:hypothetical protein